MEEIQTTVKILAGELDITPKALRNRLKRAGIEIASINQVLPQQLVVHINENKPLAEYDGPHPAIIPNASKPKPKITRNKSATVSLEEFKIIETAKTELEVKVGLMQTQLNENKEDRAQLVIKLDEQKAAVKEWEQHGHEQGESIKELAEAKTELENQVEQMAKQIKGLQKAMADQINNNPIKNRWMATTATALIAIPASFCVYFFAKEFVPYQVAIIEGASLEATYIGLAILKGLNRSQRTMAGRIGGFAMFIGMIYCTVAAALHLDPNLFDGIKGAWFWVTCALYGLPLPLLGYVVSGFLYKN